MVTTLLLAGITKLNSKLSALLLIFSGPTKDVHLDASREIAERARAHAIEYDLKWVRASTSICCCVELRC
jgi:hypothetical protein